MEWRCNKCKIFFGLVCDERLNGRKIMCVGCGSFDIEVFSYDSDIDTRLKELALEISEIKTRLEYVEGFLDNEEPADEPPVKTKSEEFH